MRTLPVRCSGAFLALSLRMIAAAMLGTVRGKIDWIQPRCGAVVSAIGLTRFLVQSLGQI